MSTTQEYEDLQEAMLQGRRLACLRGAVLIAVFHDKLLAAVWSRTDSRWHEPKEA